MIRAVALCCVLLLSAGLDAGCRCGSSPRTTADQPPTREASIGESDAARRDEAAANAMPKADRLFRRDPRWRGGDSAYSVPLDQTTSVWLFGDSFIARKPGAPRAEATMIHNSVAIQSGSVPETATLRFAWRGRADEAPRDFFPPAGDGYFWPSGGALVGDKLVVFLMRVQSTRPPDATEKPKDLGFRVVGSAARVVENPRDAPERWRMRAFAFPANPWGVKVGIGCALVYEGHLYAYSVHEPGSHDVYVVRWSLTEAATGRLERPHWWVGDGWTTSPGAGRPPRPIMKQGQTELSVFVHRRSGQLIEVQTLGFPGGKLAFRTAPRPEGPWSSPTAFFYPPEAVLPQVLVYAAKAHPQLGFAHSDALALTYNTNSLSFGAVVRDEGLYYPRFVALRPELITAMRDAQNTAGPPSSGPTASPRASNPGRP